MQPSCSRTSHCRQRLVSVTACSSENPVDISSKPAIRVAESSSGTFTRVQAAKPSSRPTYGSGLPRANKTSSISPLPSRALSMDDAACRPAAMAWMMAPGALVTSPPPKIPFKSDSRVISSTTISPLSIFIRSVPSKNDTSTACPTAIMTWSTKMHSFLSLNSGQKLPSSSNTQVHSTTSRLVTFPSSLTIRSGPHDGRISIPSALASSSSHGLAGISSMHSRQAIFTSVAPQRRAVIATSTATFPPPITTTLSFS